jgi:hypothetical protein
MNIKKSDRAEKKLEATFCKCDKKNDCKGRNMKVVHFGSKGSSTYLDHKDEDKKNAYLARHKVNENWNDRTSAGALSRFILWNKKTLTASIADFRKRFSC